jgi:hypothetical protein
MKKLSKEKKLHLLLVALATLGVIAGLWFGVIAMQEGKIKEIAQKKKGVQSEIDKVQKVVVEADQVEMALNTATNRLDAIEGTMPSASGDLFAWIVSALKEFNTPSYKVDMPQIASPGVGMVKMYPTFPYSQATVAVQGSAYYYEFGKFMADLENHFPYARVENLSLNPGAGTGATVEEREKLSFRMDIVMLVKPVAH